MTKEETIRELNSMALVLLISNNIAFKDTEKAREVLNMAIDSLEHSISLLVIEKIKTEIEANTELMIDNKDHMTRAIRVIELLSIIDQAIKECDT